MSKKKLLIILGALVVFGIVAVTSVTVVLSQNLPKLITIDDYKPHLVSQVYARGGEKIGEFFRERRLLVPYDQIPKPLVQAFVAAEDDQFFNHDGINMAAILRAFIANLQAGRKVQGGSTITQQTAKTLFLSSERTYTRKIREMMLARQMEKNFSKEEILYLYLNQIYFGQGAYGVGLAAKTYFRKEVQDLTLPEMAMLAGLPKAPSAFSPIRNPARAKERQRYVLTRMADVGFITREAAEEAINTPLQVYKRIDFSETGPYFVETVRQVLVSQLGETAVLDQGLEIHTSLEYQAQKDAEKAILNGLRELDKRQGYRGPLKNLESDEEIEKFLEESKKTLFAESYDFLVIQPDGSVPEAGPFEKYPRKNKKGALETLPSYVKTDQIVKAVVTHVDDKWGLVHVRFGEAQGLIDIETMGWARKPDPDVFYSEALHIKKPSEALKKGDVIEVAIRGARFSSDRLSKELNDLRKRQGAQFKPPEDFPKFEEYAALELEQMPDTQSALISYDLKTQDVLAMVGGSDFSKSEFNRALQAQRQTGSSYKVLIYAAALEKGYTPATTVKDAPIVFDESKENEEGQEEIEKWKPHNYSGSFRGDVLFRNALKRSLNIPTVKILEDIGVDWAMEYSRRMGIVSPLNKDMTLGLGSSSVTLYEMTKVFAQFARLGKRIRPVFIHKVLSNKGEELLGTVSLDIRFEQEIQKWDEHFTQKRQEYFSRSAASTGEGEGSQSKSLDADGNAKLEDEAKSEGGDLPGSPFYFSDEDQLIRPTTSFLVTNILQAAVREAGGTAVRAQSLGRDTAGKTGTTNGYFDAWFIGYTPQVASGVWVGYDEEKTIGRGEAGGRAALPIWLEYMESVHKDLPEVTFPVPEGIVFANIDSETGELASAQSDEVVSQAFIAGTEPKQADPSTNRQKMEVDFYKEDLAQ